MSVKYFSKLFLFTHKYQSRLLKFPNPVLNTQFRILSQSQPTINVGTQLEEFRNEKPVLVTETISSYFRRHEKYDVVKIEDIDLTEETNFKSLALLKDLVDRSEKRTSEEEPETNINPEELRNCIESECSSYSVNDILKYIILTSKVRNEDIIRNLIEYLNAELINRVFSRKEHFKILYVSGVLLGKIFFSYNFMYTKKRVLRFCEKMTSLTLEQVVVLFYLIRLFNKESVTKLSFNIQAYLLENLSKFNLDELMIISRGLLLSNINITYKSLAVALAKKVLEEIENPYELPLSRIFKVMGFSAHLLKYDLISEFQEKMLPHAGKYNGQDLVYLARIGADIAYVNLSLWEILANNFKKNIKNYSLDEIEKMVHMTVLCNIQDEELLKLSIEEFENADLPFSSFRFLISFVYDLIHHQIYPEKLLTLVLSKDFRLKYGLDTFSADCKLKYCFINSFIEFHRPESNFEFLDNKTQLQLYKLFKMYPVHKRLQFACYKTLIKILVSLENIYGKNFACLSAFQPHFKRGIVMRYDKNLEAQPIPEEFISSVENYKRALNDGHIWVFMKVLHCGNYKQDTDIPNYEIQTEIREMESFGYTPVLVHNFIWKEMRRSQDCLKDVIKNKLQEVINNQRARI